MHKMDSLTKPKINLNHSNLTNMNFQQTIHIYYWEIAVHKKRSFPLRISLNVTKSGFGHIY